MSGACQSEAEPFDQGSADRLRKRGGGPPRLGPRSLLVAIHDVAPGSLEDVCFLRGRLSRYVPRGRIAMLVIPDRWGQDRVRADTGFARRLRAWSEEGAEIFVHGWSHRDETRHVGVRSRLKAGLLTAHEGEFLGLARAEAARRMADGRALIEDLTGRRVAGFIAPAWLYGPGALAAAADLDFPLCEDHFRVWRPRGNEILCRGPVICWASRSVARAALSRAAAFSLRLMASGTRVVRIAVHPGDVRVPGIVRSIDRTVHHLTRERRVIRYGDLPSRNCEARS